VPIAPAADQIRLLSVQDLDTRIQQALHRRASHPTLETIAALDAERATLAASITETSTEVSDIRREVTKAEDDVQSVRARADRDKARLDSGQGSAKDLQALQSEVEVLAKRQSDLEDVEIEAMERLEAAESTLSAAQARADEVDAALAAAAAERDAAFAAIDGEVEALRAERAGAADGLDAGLLALYEKLRESHGGVGAAALKGSQCQGCHMDVNAGDLAAMQAAADDEVFRCEECGRILVRGA